MLKKHIGAIHCSNNLSLVQRKLFNALLFNAYPTLPKESKFSIPIRSLCNLIGYRSNDYKKLKKSLVDLMCLAVEWNVCGYEYSNQKEVWRASSLLASAKFEEGICTYEYSSLMKEFLYQPEIYGRLDLCVLAKFKSCYGIALYENCIRFQGLKQTPWFSLETFRKLMGVLGDKYTSFKEFKKRVLNIAVSEVNRYSPISIFPEIKKFNKKVQAIRFDLSHKVNTTAKKRDIVENEDESELTVLLSNNFGFSGETIKSLQSKYGSEYIREKIELIRGSESFRLGKIRDLSGLLIDALRKNYKPSQSNKTFLDQIRLTKEKNKVEEKINKENLERLESLYDEYVYNCVDDYLETLHEETYKALLVEFEKTLAGFMLKWFRQDGLNSTPVKGIFGVFLKEKNLIPCISKEKFIKEGGVCRMEYKDL